MDGNRDRQPFFADRAAANFGGMYLSEGLVWITAEPGKERSHILHIRTVRFHRKHLVQLLHDFTTPTQAGIEIGKLPMSFIGIVRGRFLPYHAVEILLRTLCIIES